MSVIHVTSDEHYAELMQENAEKTVIIDFTASWCGPCKMMAPVFDELSGEYPDLVFLKIDVDECEGAETGGSVSAMPTFRVIKNGKKEEEFKGANEEKLRAMVAKYSEK